MRLPAVKVPATLSFEHEGSSGGGGRDPTVGRGPTVRRGGSGAVGAAGGLLAVDGVGGRDVTAGEFSDGCGMAGGGGDGQWSSVARGRRR